mmetsp:Transcript_66841/g.159978  ORF Transcript_66841/g.159978 Transcript_66841/m.159978 type:complete len:446 (+) Transcript_66841:88-1425(+)
MTSSKGSLSANAVEFVPFANRSAPQSHSTMSLEAPEFIPGGLQTIQLSAELAPYTPGPSSSSLLDTQASAVSDASGFSKPPLFSPTPVAGPCDLLQRASMTGGASCLYSTDPAMHTPIKDWCGSADLSSPQVDGSWSQQSGLSLQRWVGSEDRSTPPTAPLMATSPVSQPPYRDSPSSYRAEAAGLHLADLDFPKKETALPEAQPHRRFSDFTVPPPSPMGSLPYPTASTAPCSSCSTGIACPCSPPGAQTFALDRGNALGEQVPPGLIPEVEVVGRWAGLPLPKDIENLEIRPTAMASTTTPTTAAETPPIAKSEAVDQEFGSDLIKEISAILEEDPRDDDAAARVPKAKILPEAMSIAQLHPPLPPLGHEAIAVASMPGMPTELPPRPELQPYYHQQPPPPPSVPPPPPPPHQQPAQHLQSPPQHPQPAMNWMGPTPALRAVG